MTALTLELSPELFARLRAEAERVGKPVATVAEEWLSERLPKRHRAASANVPGPPSVLRVYSLRIHVGRKCANVLGR